MPNKFSSEYYHQMLCSEIDICTNWLCARIMLHYDILPTYQFTFDNIDYPKTMLKHNEKKNDYFSGILCKLWKVYLIIGREFITTLDTIGKRNTQKAIKDYFRGVYTKREVEQTIKETIYRYLMNSSFVDMVNDI